MKIVIDIPEEEYKCVQITGCIGNETCIANTIYNGTPLPKRRSRKQHEMVEDRIHCDCGCEMIITGKWDKFLFCPTCGASLEHNEDYDYPGRRR